ncbi:hypothetical protein KZ483_24245 [Paenibacillus sp. sptzw28]|uniref:hypothetical protein n=1 Tax=Paenibacillus sp. sptzw28 TaxID=715179 RepID=UPI001C6EC748|nr:hypothetical protein [Paenibacillus sp. sptzw28]QYR20832.1 hypothetical protein KZ483_24245 [Paenibacillus sp. sptzw28]
MNKKPWKQEPLWVQRNAQGVIVGVCEQLPNGADFVPSMPPKKIRPADKEVRSK